MLRVSVFSTYATEYAAIMHFDVSEALPRSEANATQMSDTGGALAQSRPRPAA